MTHSVDIVIYVHNQMAEKIQLKATPEAQNCKHGVLVQSFCEQCLNDSKEKSSYWKIIEGLSEKNIVDPTADRRTPTYGFVVPKALDQSKKFQEEQFTIQQIYKPEDTNLPDVLDFLSNHFDPNVLNDVEGFKRKLTGVTQYGTERPAYRCFYVTNSENKIVGVRVAERIPLVSEGEVKQDKDIFYAMYIVMDPQYRGGNNIPVEMYIASLMDAAEISQKNKKEAKYLIAECSYLTERLQNKIGLKRVYLKMPDQKIKEIEFFQPSMNFDPQTGKATSAESPEHFMLYKTDKSLLNKGDVYDAIASLILQYKSNHPREYFANEDAFNAHQMYFKQKLNNIKNQLAGCEEVVQLSKDDRSDIEVIDFTQADENKEY